MHPEPRLATSGERQGDNELVVAIEDTGTASGGPPNSQSPQDIVVARLYPSERKP
jgi:hypothetical protein